MFRGFRPPPLVPTPQVPPTSFGAPPGEPSTPLHTMPPPTAPQIHLTLGLPILVPAPLAVTTNPTRIKLTGWATGHEPSSSSGGRKYGLKIAHVIEGPYAQNTIFELISVDNWAEDPYEVTKKPGFHPGDVDGNKTFDDFHCFFIDDPAHKGEDRTGSPGTIVTHQLYMHGRGRRDIIPKSGFRITKTLHKDTSGKPSIWTVTKIGCHVSITYKGERYVSTAGSGRVSWGGAYPTSTATTPFGSKTLPYLRAHSRADEERKEAPRA
jgi:hypothetical protein